MKLKTARITLEITVFGMLIMGATLLGYHVVSNKASLGGEAHYGNNNKSSDQCSLRSVSWQSYKSGDLLFSLRADKIGFRNCAVGGLIFFNLKEVYISNLSVELYPTERFSTHGAADSLKYVMQSMGDTLNSMGGTVFPKTYLLSDTDSKCLVRVVIDKITFLTHLSTGLQVRLSADTATLQYPRKIVFKGHFSGISADGTKLCASKAIWLIDWKGLYFPKGYTLENIQKEKKAFFTVGQAGRFTASECPTIETAMTEFDIIEKTVNTFLSKIVSRFFPYVSVPGYRLPQKPGI